MSCLRTKNWIKIKRDPSFQVSSFSTFFEKFNILFLVFWHVHCYNLQGGLALLASRRNSRDSIKSVASNSSLFSNEDIGPLAFQASARGRQRRTSNFLELPGTNQLIFNNHVAQRLCNNNKNERKKQKRRENEWRYGTQFIRKKALDWFSSVCCWWTHENGF